MNSRWRALLRLGLLLIIILSLFFIFPKALAFVEMAAIELRYFWWLILLVGLAIWLIWGVGRKLK